MPNGKPRRLKRLKLAEISVVGNPAQQHAKITVTKGSTNKAAAQTSEAQGHRHTIAITGNATTGLNLMLADYTGSDGESHTHPAVRTRGGWTVGVQQGHSHSLPDLRRVVEAMLLATSADSDPEPPAQKAAPTLSKEETNKAILTKLEADTAARKAAREAAEEQKKMNDSIAKRDKAAEDLEAMAEKCAGELGLSIHKAMDRVLRTPAGIELYERTIAPIEKSVADDPLQTWLCERVDKALAKASDTWDTAETIRRKRHEIAAEIEAGPEFAAKYAEVYAPAPVQKEGPDTMGLKKSGETFQQCVDRLTVERALHKGMSRATAYADMAKAGSEFLPLLEAAYSESLAASQAASASMTNGQA